MSKYAKPTKLFSPMPPRAIADKVLSGLELRTLMLVAWHDRFGANGSGCYVGQRKMSEQLQAHEKSVARSIKALSDRGYLSITKKGRRVFYSVIYDEDAKGNEAVTSKGSEGSNPEDNGSVIGNKGFEIAEKNHQVVETNIFCEAGNRDGRPENTFGKAAPLQGRGVATRLDGIAVKALQSFPAEAAPFLSEDGKFNVCGFLSRLDRAASAGTFNNGDLEKFLEIAGDTFEEFDNGSTEYGVAYRIIHSGYDYEDDGDDQAGSAYE